MNLQKGFIPLPFRVWVKDPKNIYIGSNINKYTGESNHEDDQFWNNQLENQLYKREITQEQYLINYENWLMSVKIADIESVSKMMESVTLGCFCGRVDSCHGLAIIKLIKLCHRMLR